MNKEVVLSIIVPVYNVESFLKDCIDSIERIQTPKEVICINDGSTDQSLACLQSLAERYRDIVIVNRENSGVSQARNHGIRLAKGKYICFFDGDDMVVGETVDHAVKLLEDGQADCVSFAHQEIGEHCRYDDCVIPSREVVFHGASHVYPKGYIWHLVMKKDILDDQNITFPDMRYFEDKCFAMQYCLCCRKVMATSEVGYLYRQRTNSVMHCAGRYKPWFADAIKAAVFMEELKEKGDDEFARRCRHQKQLFILHAMMAGVMVADYTPEYVLDTLAANGLFPIAPMWRLLVPNGSSTLLNYVRFGFFSKHYYVLFCRAVRKIRNIR